MGHFNWLSTSLRLNGKSLYWSLCCGTDNRFDDKWSTLFSTDSINDQGVGITCALGVSGENEHEWDEKAQMGGNI